MIGVIVVIIIILIYIHYTGTSPFFNPFITKNIIYFTEDSLPYIKKLHDTGVEYEIVTFAYDERLAKYNYTIINRVALSNKFTSYANMMIEDHRLDDISLDYVKIAQLASHYDIEIIVVLNDNLKKLFSPYLNGEKISAHKNDPISLFGSLRFISE